VVYVYVVPAADREKEEKYNMSRALCKLYCYFFSSSGKRRNKHFFIFLLQKCVTRLYSRKKYDIINTIRVYDYTTSDVKTDASSARVDKYVYYTYFYSFEYFISTSSATFDACCRV